MTIEAKPLLKNKFWILEDSGSRVGTLTKEENSYILSEKGRVTFYENEKQLKKKFGKNFLTAKIVNKDGSTLSENEVQGYPTRSTPYNSMYDINRKLPLFTKSEKSKSVYCAGYYLIKFNVNWLKSFCPKLVTVESNQYMGPFKTEFELKVALNNANKQP